MCCTLGPAILSKTILLATSLEVDGRVVNVMGYQNSAKNLSRGPNAMILPIPSKEAMASQNCIDMTAAPRVLKDYAEELIPRSRGMSMTLGGGMMKSARVEVFVSGSYTVALAADASDIPSALDRIPQERRPALHPEIFEAYKLWYPGWSVALCCWNGEIEAEPLLWWYHPTEQFRDHHFFPGLDGHDGRVPDPAAKVNVDHTLIVGHAGVRGEGHNVSRMNESIAEPIRRWLPAEINGRVFDDHNQPNGDWVIAKGNLSAESMRKRMTRDARVPPPGFGTA